MNLFVRSAGDDPGLLASSVRKKIQSMYPNQPVERIMVMHDVVSRTLAQRSYSVGLMTIVASLALLLCGLGIYRVVSYVTWLRTREFGIRMALGATRRDVLQNVLQQGGSLVAVGVALGVGLSLFATRALSQLLFETPPLRSDDHRVGCARAWTDCCPSVPAAWHSRRAVGSPGRVEHRVSLSTSRSA